MMSSIIIILIVMVVVNADYVYDEEADRLLWENLLSPKHVRMAAASYSEPDVNKTNYYDYSMNLYKTEIGDPEPIGLPLCLQGGGDADKIICQSGLSSCVNSIYLLDFDGNNICLRSILQSSTQCFYCYEGKPHNAPMGNSPRTRIFIGMFETNNPRDSSLANGIVFRNGTAPCYIGSSKNTDGNSCKTDSLIIQDYLRMFAVVGRGLTRDTNVKSIVENQWIKSISSYSCLQNGVNCDDETYASCRVGLCKGEQKFCNIFGCSGVKQCYCTYDVTKTELVAKANNAIGTFSSSYTLPITRYEDRIRFDDLIPACYGISMQCDKTKIVAVEANTKMTNVRVIRGPWNVFYSLEDDSESIIREMRMPLEMALLGDDIKADIWVRDFSTPCNITFSCDAMSICEAIDCFFCMQAWSSVGCYGAGQWGILSVVVILVSFPLYLVLKVFFFVIRFLLWNNKFLKAMIIYFWLKLKIACIWIRRKVSGLSSYLSSDLERMRNLEKDQELLKEKEKSTKNEAKKTLVKAKEHKLDSELSRLSERIKMSQNALIHKQSKSNRLFSSLVLLITLFSFVDGCSEISTFSVENNACTTSSSGTTTCSVKQSMILSAAPIGQYACFNVNSPDGKPMGSIQVKFTSMNIKCVKYKMYYVPDVEPDPISYFRCDGAGGCNGEQCNSIQANNNQLDSIPYVQDQRGKRIDGGCSLINSGDMTNSESCFYGQGCLYWSLALKKKSEKVIEQSACSSWEFVMDTEISVLNLENSSSVKLSLSPGFTESINENLHISLISASVPPTYLTNQCIGRSGQRSSVYPCNKKDTLIAGLIGELQCPTEASASSLIGCYSASGSFETTANSKGIVTKSHLIDVWKVFDGNSLPFELSNGISVYQDGSGEVFTTFPGKALTQLSLTIDDMKLTYVSTKSACSISSVSLTGCYSCVNGADWSFIGKTDFGTAVATVKCPSIGFMTLVSLTPTTTENKVKISMTEGDVNANCIVECPGGSTNFVLRGTLDWIPPEDPRDNTTVSGETNLPGSGDFWSQLWSMISGIFYWSLGSIGVIIFIVLLILLVRNVLIPLCRGGASLLRKTV